VARLFEHLLMGALKREDVRARLKDYTAEFKKLFPTKYAKFGNSPLVSLDEVMFEDGSTTRGDIVQLALGFCAFQDGVGMAERVGKGWVSEFVKAGRGY
jgi:hypothetical protein